MILTEILSQIKQRADKATPGPWERELGYWEHYGFGIIVGDYEKEGGNTNEPQCLADVTFINHSRSDIPRLLAALEKCREQRDAGRLATLPEPHIWIDRDDAELVAILNGSEE